MTITAPAPAPSTITAAGLDPLNARSVLRALQSGRAPEVVFGPCRPAAAVVAISLLTMIDQRLTKYTGFNVPDRALATRARAARYRESYSEYADLATARDRAYSTGYIPDMELNA